MFETLAQPYIQTHTQSASPSRALMCITLCTFTCSRATPHTRTCTFIHRYIQDTECIRPPLSRDFPHRSFPSIRLQDHASPFPSPFPTPGDSPSAGASMRLHASSPFASPDPSFLANRKRSNSHQETHSSVNGGSTGSTGSRGTVDPAEVVSFINQRCGFHRTLEGRLNSYGRTLLALQSSFYRPDRARARAREGGQASEQPQPHARTPRHAERETGTGTATGTKTETEAETDIETETEIEAEIVMERDLEAELMGRRLPLQCEEIHHTPSHQEFLREYLSKSKPVVMCSV